MKKALSFILCGGMLAACARNVEHTTDTSPADGGNSSQDAPASIPGIAVRTASAEECAAGGSVYTVFLDDNRNGAKDEDETAVSSQVVCNGTAGATGPTGASGSDGKDGENGKDGKDGAAAPVSPFQTVEVIQACGASVSAKEVLLRLANGQILAVFSDETGGTMTRLVLLADGTYMNTDHSGCIFTLSTSEDGKTRSISWDGQVRSSWSVIP